MRQTLSMLRRRITVEAPVEEPDGAGGVRRTWRAQATVSAGIHPVKAGDAYPLGLPGQAVSHRILMRWRPGLTTANRLRFGGRIFALRAVFDPDERRRWLSCLAQELRP